MSILNRNLLFWSWLLVSATLACAQPIDTLWSQRFSDNGQDNGPLVKGRAEGGYALCYSTTSYSVGDYQIRLTLLDSGGNVESDKLYGGPDNEVVWEFHQTSDGGYIIAGQTGSYGPNELFWSGWIIKTDANGDSLWSRVVSFPYGDRIVTSITETETETESEYVSLVYNGSGGYDRGVSLLRLDADGDSLNELRIRVYASADTTLQLTYGHLIRCTDGGILATTNAIGHCAYCPWELERTDHIWALRTTAQLDSIWMRNYRFDQYSLPRTFPSVVQVNDGSFVIQVTDRCTLDSILDNNARILCVDSSGEVTWNHVFGNEWESYSYSLAKTPDNNVLVAGGLSIDGNETSQNWLFKVDAEGDSLWSVRVGDAEVYRFQDIAATSDGGYILATTRNDWEGYWALDIELYRFGPEDLSPIDGRPIGVPQKITLSAYPNPFNAVTTLSIELPQAGQATINVYDVQGRLVRTLINDYLLPGSHRYSFNGGDIGSGTYFVRLDANKMQDVRKIVLVK